MMMESPADPTDTEKSSWFLLPWLLVWEHTPISEAHSLQKTLQGIYLFVFPAPLMDGQIGTVQSQAVLRELFVCPSPHGVIGASRTAVTGGY